MDYNGAEKRIGTDDRRSGIDRRENTLSGVGFERRSGAGDRRQQYGRRSTDGIPVEMIEQMR
jgi:hypothetical protein